MCLEAQGAYPISAASIADDGAGMWRVNVVGAARRDGYVTGTPQDIARGGRTRRETGLCRSILRAVVMGQADANLGVAPHGKTGTVKRVGT